MAHSAAQAASATIYGRRIVFFNVAETKTEPELLQLFSRHGVVADMFIVRSALGLSSGCGYVTYTTPEQAQIAVTALNGSTDGAEPGTVLGALCVAAPTRANHSPDTSLSACTNEQATPNASVAQATSVASTSAEGKLQVFFTKVPPTVTSQQLIQLFTACGEVAHLELFIPWPGAKISRGCGLVEFTCSTAAAAAVESLHQQFTWPHSHSALVVEWVDRSHQNSKPGKNRNGSSSNVAPQGATGSSTPPAHRRSLRAEGHLQQGGAAAVSAWRPSYALSGPARTMTPRQQFLQTQQQAGQGVHTRSCPLPQLPPGWQVLGTSQQLPSAVGVTRPVQCASASSSLSSAAGTTLQQAAAAPPCLLSQQQLLPLANQGNALVLQQQQQQNSAGCSDATAAGAWLACPVTTGTLSNNSVDLPSYTSLGSMYDAALLSSSTLSSTTNSAANSGALSTQLWDNKQQQQQTKILDIAEQELTAWSATNGSHNLAVFGNHTPEQAMTSTTTGLPSCSDPIYQQLLQQQVLMFQNMAPEEEPAVGHLLLPTSAAAAQQHALLAVSSCAADVGTLAACLPAHLPISQGSQTLPGAALFNSRAIGAAQLLQDRQQQMWWLQQVQEQQINQDQQQQQANAAAVVTLPLTQQQLVAMSGVLPEVPRLTGVQAWISTDAAGGLQLYMSGSYTQLQAGHTAVSLLLRKAGVCEPLAPATVHASVN